MFQVKAIRKDVRARKTIVPSFMFLFNLSKPVALCVKNNTLPQINFLVRSLKVSRELFER